jgi:glycosyltransferase involved in cell wall biosynthesis
MISTIIPIRDREISRLKRCIKYLKKANKSCGNPIREIIVVDYGSKSPLKQDKSYKLIRVEADCWNKAHAMNLGILSSKEPYILTIDVDMLIDEKHLREITKNLSEENFIIDTNVRRLDKGYLHLPYYEEMVSVSNPWFSQSRNQLFNLANGGFQVYPRTFYDKIGGIMEGMGKFHRAVDNWVFYMARMNNMNTVDISYPLLHLEHKKQKEDHYDKEIREQAEAYAIYKAWYLGKIIF